MNKNLFIILAAMLFFFGCNKSNQFKVTLNIDDADNQSVYLFKNVDGKSVCIDSAVFAGKNAVMTVAELNGGTVNASGHIIIDGEVYGRALRTHKDVKPIFISIGNFVSLDTACALALKLTDRESHIPIPTRLADLETHIARDQARNAAGQA